MSRATRKQCRECGGKGRHENHGDILGTETCLGCAGRGWVYVPAEGELALADASRRLRRQKRRRRWTLMDAVLCPPNGIWPTKQKTDSLVEFAKLIALARVTRPVRDENGAYIGVERIEGCADVAPEDLLKADSFIDLYRRRPMA